MRSDTEEQVRAILAGRPDVVGLPSPMMYPWDRVEVARRAHLNTGLTFADEPAALAFALKLEVRLGRAASCGELTNGKWIRFEWDISLRECGIRLLHAIAHVLLRREGWCHTEADVWLLTLELLAPVRALRRMGVREVARQAHGPEWLVIEWAEAALRLGAHSQQPEMPAE